MKRRAFITLLGGAAAAWPLVARAQQAAMPVVGYLNARSLDDSPHLVAAFRRGLAENGYVEGQTVTIEYRWALGQYDRLPMLAAELARRPVTVLAATGGEASALAAKAASSTIPIVFSIGGDPVRLGLVESYNRPGGNMTGINILTATLEAKRLGLLHEMVPRAAAIGVLLNPNNPPSEVQLKDVEAAGRAVGLQIHALWAGTDREIDAAFENIVQQRIAALAVTAGPFFDTRRDKLVALAAHYAVPTMYQFREYTVAGGLMSYGIDVVDVYRQVAVYVGRILKGEKAAELPVLQPTKFQFVINLKTANALGLNVPSGLSAMADEVIE
jgi:putative tryptophan/tyrosine transport system substrate-binding protein